LTKVYSDNLILSTKRSFKK